jgi:hypothetical protein
MVSSRFLQLDMEMQYLKAKNRCNYANKDRWINSSHVVQSLVYDFHRFTSVVEDIFPNEGNPNMTVHVKSDRTQDGIE